MFELCKGTSCLDGVASREMAFLRDFPRHKLLYDTCDVLGKYKPFSRFAVQDMRLKDTMCSYDLCCYVGSAKAT